VQNKIVSDTNVLPEPVDLFLIQALVEGGAKVEVDSRIPSNEILNMSPIMRAAAFGHVELVHYFVHETKVDLKSFWVERAVVRQRFSEQIWVPDWTIVNEWNIYGVSLECSFNIAKLLIHAGLDGIIILVSAVLYRRLDLVKILANVVKPTPDGWRQVFCAFFETPDPEIWPFLTQNAVEDPQTLTFRAACVHIDFLAVVLCIGKST
jgi:hypothetical protein